MTALPTNLAVLRSRHVSRLVATMLAVMCLLLNSPARSSALGNFTTGEVALLPDFCQDRLYFAEYTTTHPKWSYWVSRMGKSFKHVHHYCWALLNLRRAEMSPSKAKRVHLVSTAINDLEYVVKNTTPDFLLLPEVYTRIGDSAVQLGDFGKAFDSYAKARELKPSYPPAYTGWAELLIKSGKANAAKELVEQGLRHAPDSPDLQLLYKRLGGNLNAFPSPAGVPKTASSPDASVFEAGLPASSAASGR